MAHNKGRRLGFNAKEHTVAARRSRIETVTYSMPVYWASYLINGDASGIDDDEIAEADAAIEDIGLGAPVDVGESEFRHSGDYGHLAGDYADYTFHKIAGKRSPSGPVDPDDLRRAVSMYQPAQVFINGRYQVTGTITPTHGIEAEARTVLGITRPGDLIEVKQGENVWSFTRTENEIFGPNHRFAQEQLREARAPRHRVADFNTLDDLIAHARDELGASHVVVAGPESKIYFPRGGTHAYEAASVRRKGGYWHADGPGAREGVRSLPAAAQPIGGGRAGQRAAEHVEGRRGESRKYWIVEQEQYGLWAQVGHFHDKSAAERFRKTVPGKTQIVHAYPSAHDHAVLRAGHSITREKTRSAHHHPDRPRSRRR